MSQCYFQCWFECQEFVCEVYLLAQGHATAQSTGEADDFGNKSFEGEVFFQHHTSKDSFHLWNTRACSGDQKHMSAFREPRYWGLDL